MATMHEIEVWVLINSDGEYAAHASEDDLSDAYVDQVGDLSEAGGLRRVKITLKVPLPETIEVSGEVTVEETVGELKAV